jgi:hypothetical protein
MSKKSRRQAGTSVFQSLEPDAARQPSMKVKKKKQKKTSRGK